MGLDTSATNELQKYTLAKNVTDALRTKWDADWALVRLDSEEYNIPTEEGEWEQVVSNRAAAEFYKITDYLAYARRKLWIPVKAEDKGKRSDLTLTEQLAIGCMHLADNLETDSPFKQNSQDALAFFRVMRGWSSIRFILRQEEGKLIPDVAFWDPRNTYWQVGKKRLVWVCYERWATKEEIQDEYPGCNGPWDSDNRAAVYDVWGIETDKDTPGGTKIGDAFEGVIIGHDYVKEPEPIGKDYIPVRINAGRTTPLVFDAIHQDNIKMIGENFLASNRTLYPAESRLLSYQMTRASQLAKAARVIEFNSDLAPQPPGFDQDPWVAGRTMFLDVGKGQALKESLTPPSGADIAASIQMIQGMESIGGLSPVAWGQINQALPAQGIDILTHSTLDAIKPFKLGMEDDYKWWAEEIVRQFKNGDFNEYDIEGVDNSDFPFEVKVEPDKIEDKWRFKCELIPDLQRDKAANINWMATAIKHGILSIESAREEAQIVTDTDLEAQKVAREQADTVLNIGPAKAVMAFIEDWAKSDNPADRFLASYAMEQLQLQMGGGQGAQPGQGQQEPSTEDNTVQAANTAVPPAVQAAAQEQIAQQSGGGI